MSTKYFADPFIATKQRTPVEKLFLKVKDGLGQLKKRLERRPEPTPHEATEALLKALEVGSYDAAPLKTGSVLKIEPLEATMKAVRYQYDPKKHDFFPKGAR